MVVFQDNLTGQSNFCVLLVVDDRLFLKVLNFLRLSVIFIQAYRKFETRTKVAVGHYDLCYI